MHLSKKWRLLLIPVLLGIGIYLVQLWLAIPIPSGGSLPVIERIDHESRYIILPKSLKLGQSIEFQVHIESYEHPETHAVALEERILLTLNDEEPLLPEKLTTLSQDDYHVKSLVTFSLPKNLSKLNTLKLLIFDHDEHSFDWEL